MRALRTIPVMDDFARDMAEVCPDALFLNYTNPMAMLTGYMLQLHTDSDSGSMATVFRFAQRHY